MLHLSDYLQVLAVNADNASANDMQMHVLATLNNSFEVENHVRCFNHTLQLSAKTLVKPFNVALSSGLKDDGSLTNEDEDDMPALEDCVDDTDDDTEGADDDKGKSKEFSDDETDEFDQLNEVDREELLEDTAAVREMVSKVHLYTLLLCWLLPVQQLRKLSFAVIHSTTIALPAWRHACETHKLKSRLIPHDVVTRWNSTHDMMEFALKYRKPIDDVTADKKLNLRKFELDNDDWKIIEDLVAILHVCDRFPHLFIALMTSQIYKKATVFFSHDSAGIAAVIPAMDKIMNSLNPQTKEPYHSAILAAIKLAQKKMNQYYSLTDVSTVYRTAMGMSDVFVYVSDAQSLTSMSWLVLHPGLKLEYFKQHEWLPEWIQQAESLTCDEFLSMYAKDDKLEGPSDDPSMTAVCMSPPKATMC